MPENALSGNACVSCAIFASDSGRIAGPPRPPLETKPSTFISNSSVSGSMSGSDGKVFDEVIASAPPRNAPRASTTMSVVDGVSLAQIGTRATSFTASVTIEIELLVLADVRAHVLAVHVRARQVQLERVGALVLAGLRERLPVRRAPRRCPSRP